MPDLWCQFAEQNRAPTSSWGPPITAEKGVLHTTESRGRFRPGGSYFGHQSWPHFTVSAGKVWQHIPINRAAKALRNLAGGVQTNNDGAIQIEIDWQAADIANLPAADVDALRRLMRWIEREARIPATCGVEFHPYPPPVRLGREPWRLSGPAWDAYRGWCGHQHVPENDHGDPGLIDIAALLPAPPPPPPPEDPTVFTVVKLHPAALNPGEAQDWIIPPNGPKYHCPHTGWTEALIKAGAASIDLSGNEPASKFVRDFQP